MRKKIEYIIKTFMRLILLLIMVSIFTFLLVSSSPINTIDAYIGGETNISYEQRENIEDYWGLNQPPINRYFIWISNLLSGDMGQSITYREPVVKVIKERFLASVLLMGFAWLLSGIFGFLFGIIAGIYKDRFPDRIIKALCLILSSAPIFFIGMLILIVFSINLGWFPIGLSAPIGILNKDVTFLSRIHHLILPAITLGITGISNIALHTRQKTIEATHSDYMLFAMARGESKTTAIFRHGLRNISIPAIALQFSSFSELFGGSFLAEQVFSYPGLGNAATIAGLKGDVPLLLGIALFSAVFVFVGNFISNILYGILDPRIREDKSYE